jgi:hypothetical protein
MSETNINDLQSITIKMNDFSEEELKAYFDDIIKSKIIVRDLFLVNVEAYENKIKQNQITGQELQDKLNQLKLKHENEAKLLKDQYKKCDEDLKKHAINLKLLSKTKEHYEILIKEKLREIHTIKSKNVFINQDILNRKLQLNSVQAQIEDAEYQNKNLKASVKSKYEELNLSKYDEQQLGSNQNIVTVVEDNNTDNISLNERIINRYKPPEFLSKNIEEKFSDLKSNYEIKSDYDKGNELNYEKSTSQVFEVERSNSKSFVDKAKKKCIIF